MSNTSSCHYKRYLEPNCEPEQRHIPRKTKYRKKFKHLSTSTNEVLLKAAAPDTCGEVSINDTDNAVQDICIRIEVSFFLNRCNAIIKSTVTFVNTVPDFT